MASTITKDSELVMGLTGDAKSEIETKIIDNDFGYCLSYYNFDYNSVFKAIDYCSNQKDGE